MLPKTSASVKRYDGQTKRMYFLIKDDDFLNKYGTTCNKVSADIKKEFGSETVYNKKNLKTKIRFYGEEVTDLIDKEIPESGSDCTCLAVISLDSVLKKDQNYSL